MALVHGKISPLPGGTSRRVDVTVKSNYPGLSQGLSLYLQNMIRYGKVKVRAEQTLSLSLSLSLSVAFK